jgi:hypothetical protein
MIERTKPAGLLHTLSRRQLATGIAMAFGGLASASSAFAQAMQEKPGTLANGKRTSLHEDIHLKAGPQRIYEVLLDAKQFAAFTSLPAEIDPKPGEPFPYSAGKSSDGMSNCSPTRGSCRRGAQPIGALASIRSLSSN